MQRIMSIITSPLDTNLNINMVKIYKKELAWALKYFLVYYLCDFTLKLYCSETNVFS